MTSKALAWGALGEPTADQVRQWRALPYGKFRSMIEGLRRAPIKTFLVTATRASVTSSTATLEVTPTDRSMTQRDFDASDSKFSEPTIVHRPVTYTWVEKRPS